MTHRKMDRTRQRLLDERVSG